MYSQEVINNITTAYLVVGTLWMAISCIYLLIVVFVSICLIASWGQDTLGGKDLLIQLGWLYLVLTGVGISWIFIPKPDTFNCIIGATQCKQ